MYRLFFCIALACAGGNLAGNDIYVSNLQFGAYDPVEYTLAITFDLEWQHAWRVSTGPANHDAAWVFVKYRVNDGVWHHAGIGSSPALPAGAAGVTASDGRGAFIYPAGDFMGAADYNGVALTLTLDPSFLYLAEGSIEVKVIAIEMVYVPEGDFELGSDGGESGEFYRTAALIFSNGPYPVTGEAAMGYGVSFGDLTPGSFLGSLFLSETIPAAFPKGHAAFWCMKYETSQRQFTEFFNMLPPDARAWMDISDLGANQAALLANRNGFYWTGSGDAVTLYPQLPIGNLSAEHMMAYLDWSGLRPMTELEYEKACRGAADPVADEYAWGTDALHGTAYTVEVADTEDEWISNVSTSGTVGNGLYAGNASTGGPLRIGSFAASGSAPGRPESGGSYFGIMELSGNLSELTITVANDNGRAYSGIHGDGSLTAAGAADVSGWPLGTDGYGHRGGSFATPAANLRVSHRGAASDAFTAAPSVGFRGVRTAE